MATEPVEIGVRRLAHGEDLPLPERATAGASGMDLRAAVDTAVVLEPGARTLVPTGLTLAIPEGWEGQVRPRSGLALESGVTVANAPGTIDSDYRGEVRVILINLGSSPVSIGRGDRIAQLVVAPVAAARMQELESLPETGRGTGGFGSTGTS